MRRFEALEIGAKAYAKHNQAPGKNNPVRKTTTVRDPGDLESWLQSSGSLVTRSWFNAGLDAYLEIAKRLGYERGTFPVQFRLEDGKMFADKGIVKQGFKSGRLEQHRDSSELILRRSD